MCLSYLSFFAGKFEMLSFGVGVVRIFNVRARKFIAVDKRGRAYVTVSEQKSPFSGPVRPIFGEITRLGDDQGRACGLPTFADVTMSTRDFSNPFFPDY
jgi:hypothetical protein